MGPAVKDPPRDEETQRIIADAMAQEQAEKLAKRAAKEGGLLPDDAAAGRGGGTRHEKKSLDEIEEEGEID